MAVALGILEYSLGNVPVVGNGYLWTEDDLNTALAERVAAVVFDDLGIADLHSLLNGVPDTDFDYTGVQRVLESISRPENWRVGEALAETYLVDHRLCCFPWPDGRDERKSGSSLPGADLVGLQRDGEDDDRFAFGEIKTSNDENCPPGLMYGRTGMKQQLDDLRDNLSIRDVLVRYMGYRAIGAPWKNRFIKAFRRYISNPTDIQLFGFLVRDVPPHADDCRARVTKLANGCPGAMSIELLALYIPADSIMHLSDKVIDLRRGDVT
jgi:hypothetical protein